MKEIIASADTLEKHISVSHYDLNKYAGRNLVLIMDLDKIKRNYKGIDILN